MPSVEKSIQYAREHDTIVRVPKRCASSGKEIDICYNDFGKKEDPCILLIQGVGTSLLGYDVEGFIQYFVDAHYRVIRFDNRDVGKSTNFNEYNDANLTSLLRLGLPAWASVGEKQVYTLDDMVEDCYGLLQVLELVERGVHIFGVSMGGMIAQQYCITHPDTVLSMTLHMTHAGIGDCIKPPLLTYLMFLKRPKSDSPRDVAESMADFVDTLSHGYRYEKDERGNILENEHNRQMREKVVSFFERISERDGAQNSLGLPRQAVAVMRAPKRLQRLRDVCGKYQIPVVVMHGGRDPLIPVSNGYQLAEAIPHAQLVVFPEVGHDFPEDLTRTFAEQTMLNMKTGELKKNSEKKK